MAVMLFLLAMLAMVSSGVIGCSSAVNWPGLCGVTNYAGLYLTKVLLHVQPDQLRVQN
jgi:hypothetical protein